ncbi:Retrovirus-related Pol polyprotein from transposon 17.6 [Trichinella sp. T8]|nr:Retrovirus-related Pol polyprotein from transposon 17.6 [Trichinella sp. T8]
MVFTIRRSLASTILLVIQKFTIIRLGGPKCYSEITISPSSLLDCIIGFLKGGKVSSFDNPTTTVTDRNTPNYTTTTDVTTGPTVLFTDSQVPTTETWLLRPRGRAPGKTRGSVFTTARSRTENKAFQVPLIQERVKYLGHVVSRDGVQPDPEKIKAVEQWPIPKCSKELQQFLGLAYYYRRFVKGFAQIAEPLHRLTETEKPWNLTDECDKAFLHLKARLTKQPVLTHPDFKIPFLVDTDASGDGLGAVLSQDIAGKEHPHTKQNRKEVLRHEKGNAGPGMGAKVIPLLLIRAKIHNQNGSRQFDVAEELQRTRRSGCTMAATARRIRLRSYLSARQKTSKRRRAIKGIVQAVWPKHPYILHNSRQYSAFKSEMATQSYMACVDTSSAGDGTTERSGYRTDMPVGGYKDTSRKMPDWKQQDAAESITTERSVDGKRRHPAPQTNGARRAQSRSPTGSTTNVAPRHPCNAFIADQRVAT